MRERTNERTGRGGPARWRATKGNRGGPLVSDYGGARAPSGTSTRPRKDSHAASGPLSVPVRVHALPFSLSLPFSFFPLLTFPAAFLLSFSLPRSRFPRTGYLSFFRCFFLFRVFLMRVIVEKHIGEIRLTSRIFWIGRLGKTGSARITSYRKIILFVFEKLYLEISRMKNSHLIL